VDSGTILLMRHAEKPADVADIHLSPAGAERAEELASYIPKTFGKPDFLFAAANSKHSYRPVETVEPLSRATGLSIDSSHPDDDYAALASKLLTKPHFEGKLTLVCWHHEKIPHFAKALGAGEGDIPDPWDPDVFNLILQFGFKAGKLTVKEIKEPF
jgi:phosphohistidine phosphatase SixA